MDFLYFLLWLIVGASAAFALVWLGLFFQSLKKAVDTAVSEIVPVVKKLDESIAMINEDLARIDSTFSKIEAISKKINEITDTAEKAVAPVSQKVNAYAQALVKAVRIIFKGK